MTSASNGGNMPDARSLAKQLEVAETALRMIQDGPTDDSMVSYSWAAGVAMSALSSLSERRGTCSCGGGFTYAMQLCDDDGIVRRGAMHKGVDYPCTTTAHFTGEHIYCTSPAHQLSEDQENAAWWISHDGKRRLRAVELRDDDYEPPEVDDWRLGDYR